MLYTGVQKNEQEAEKRKSASHASLGEMRRNSIEDVMLEILNPLEGCGSV